jgi:hypothetical protein
MRNRLALLLSMWILGGPLSGQPKNQPSNQSKPANPKTVKPQTDQRGTKDLPLVVNVLNNPQSKPDATNASEEKSKEFNDRLVA